MKTHFTHFFVSHPAQKNFKKDNSLCIVGFGDDINFEHCSYVTYIKGWDISDSIESWIKGERDIGVKINEIVMPLMVR